MNMQAPATPSGFSTDKPFLSLINIDLLNIVLHGTFLHPFFCWLFPLALRAVTFQYHHPPLWGSIIFSTVVTLYWLGGIINTRIAYGRGRKMNKTEEVMVVTGGSSGLGLLIAQVYGMRGMSVAVLDIREPEVDVMNVSYYNCDVGDKDQVRKAAKQIQEDLGTPTILINNAAIVNGKSIIDLSEEEVENNFRTNVLAHFWTIKQFLPGMIEEKQGTIVTISSALSHIGPKNCSDYAASKAAVRILHDSLTAEVAEYPDIKTLIVTPGQLNTPLFYGVQTPSNFFAPVLEPIEVAKELISYIDSGCGGEIALPLYSRWIVIMRSLPASVQRLLRWMSGCDNAMKTFKGRVGLAAEENDEEKE